MSTSESGPVTWWGDYTFADGDAKCWTLGQLELAVHRLSDEWRIAWRREEPREDARDWSVADCPGSLQGWDNVERHACRHTEQSLKLVPLLADRPVVVRPVSPFTLPAGENTRLFISTPLWVGVQPGENGVSLVELPIVRPSDTWFGTDTRSGELCYASNTRGHMRISEVPLRLHRALTCLRISNESIRSLRLERLSLPVPYLSLFEDRSHALWTQDVEVRRERDTAAASLTLDKGLPSQAESAVPVGVPREKSNEPVLRRALSALFG